MGEHDIRLEQLFPGVLRLRLPTPFKVGDVNAYVFVGEDGFAIIDPGPGSSRNLALLEEALARFGLRLSQSNSVLLTHGHEDHGGLSSDVAGLSDAKIFVGAEDRGVLGTNVRNVFRSNRDRIIGRFRKLGFPEHELGLLPAYFEARDYYRNPPVRTEILHGGEFLSAGNTMLKVIASPGHTMGSVCFYMEKPGALFSGDTLIDHITPNPGAAIYNDILFRDEIDYDPLKVFLATLGTLKDLDARVAYPGHGKPVRHPGKLINGYIEHHDKRLRQIVASLSDGPLTCRDVSNAVFGISGKIDEAILQVMEVYAHLIYLEGKAQVSGFPSCTGCRMYRRADR